MRKKIIQSQYYKVALSILTAAIILALTAVVILYAQGYRLENRGLTSTGQLVLKSTPDASSVFINNKFVAATNSNLNLSPGEYSVKIVKDGYATWEKKLKIEAEVVTATDAILFPAVPEFRRVTSTGAINPTLSADGTKIAYGVDASTAYPPNNGVYVMDIGNRNSFFSGSSTQYLARDIAGVVEFSKGKFLFSPDGKQLLVYFTSVDNNENAQQGNTETQNGMETQNNNSIGLQNITSAYLLDTTKFNGEEIPDATLTLDQTLAAWDKEKKQEATNQFNLLKPDLKKVATASMEILNWTVDESKFMYRATRDTAVPVIIKPRVVGANSTPEIREIKKDFLYIYDTKEDRNYQIPNKKILTNTNQEGSGVNLLPTTDYRLQTPLWLATSRHYITIEDDKIYVTEYDGTNKTAVYSGGFDKNFIAPAASGDRIYFLTSFSPGVAPNLYALLIR